MSNEKNLNLLEKIVFYCNDIEKAIKRLGDDIEVFRGDSLYINAVAMCVMQIGELSTHFTDEFRSTFSDIPWKQIRGMRNVLAHQYGVLSLNTMWRTIKTDIPQLKNQCESILKQFSVLEQQALEPDLEEDMEI